MDLTEPTGIGKDIAFQAAPPKQQFNEQQPDEQELFKTKSRLEEEHPEWTVSNPKCGRLRIKDDKNNIFNYSDEDGKLLSEEWFLNADDFEETNGQKTAPVWVLYFDGNDFGKELKRIRPDGTFVENSDGITMKLLEEPPFSDIQQNLEKIQQEALDSKENEEKVKGAIKATIQILIEKINTFDGKSRIKAWNIINEKGEDIDSIIEKLTYNIIGSGGPFSHLADDDTRERLWEYINEKGTDKTAVFLASIIIPYSYQDDFVKKVWSFIEKASNKKEISVGFVKGICQEIEKWNLRYGSDYWGDISIENGLSSKYDRKIWDFVFENGDHNEIASVLLENIKEFNGGDIETAWNYILDKSNGTKSATFLASIIGKIPQEKLENYNTINFIIEQGNSETFAVLKTNLKNLSMKDRLKVRRFIKKYT
jgi:hypothetical protein